MKHYETKQIPATTTSQLKRTSCDLCEGDIINSRHEINDVRIRHREGNIFPESSAGKETTLDMCGNCFTTKFIPFIESNGACLKVTEWDY